LLILRGDIYWLDFGIPVGSVQGGRRLALVVQNDAGNYSSPTTIVAAITSKEKKPYPFHVEISARESGLTLDSTILLEQLFTINKNRLTEKAGRLFTQKMREVDNALKASLGIFDMPS
jgi:mRNA interferase MazF